MGQHDRCCSTNGSSDARTARVTDWFMAPVASKKPCNHEPYQPMKYIATRSFILAAGLAVSSFLAKPSFGAAHCNPGHPEAELINLETLKTIYLFGTPAQKQLGIEMFDPD